jgi:hypothetical protein
LSIPAAERNTMLQVALCGPRVVRRLKGVGILGAMPLIVIRRQLGHRNLGVTSI